MKMRSGAAVLFFFLSLACAQADSLVVQTCGTLPLAYAPGATRNDTVDVNGNKCVDVVIGGGSAPGAGSQPYNYTPLSPGQYGLAVTSSTGLTIPTGALQAQVCASGNNVNYTWDGTTTPTASVGQPLLQNQCIQFSGATLLANLKFIQTASTATLNVGYTK